MDAEQIKTLLDMRMAKYPDHACLMQELTFKDEKIAALESENARLKEALRECITLLIDECEQHCDWPCDVEASCSLRFALAKAREALGNE